MVNAYFHLLKERGLVWFINRSLYSLKLIMLRSVPWTEKLFDKPRRPVSQINIFDVDINRIKELLTSNLSNEEKQNTIRDANNACRGKLKGFSSIELDFGYPYDWQRNPITGNKCDVNKKWYQIPDFDEDRGDIKVIWEASRFSQFVLFARAYLLTSDSRYYIAFSDVLKDWLEKNPYSFGANYKCGQECAIRMINCLLAYSVFKDVANVVDENNVRELVSRCYRKILSNFFYAHRCIRNNHTISELAGMIVGSWCCTDYQQLEKAYKLLDEVIDEQFTKDGGYIQQSFNYQRLALQVINVVISINEKTKLSLSDNSYEKVLNSALLMYQCQDENGDVPNYGSNDGALVFPLSSCCYRDFRPTLQATTGLLKKELLYTSGAWDEEAIWMGVRKNSKHILVQRETSCFPQAGLYTIRNDHLWCMLVAKEKLDHMDENHLDLWINGINVLCDAGTYSYVGKTGKELFSTKSHNTMVCDGKEQLNRLGAFAVYGQPKHVMVQTDGQSIRSSVTFSSGYKHIRNVRVSGNRLYVEDEASEFGEVLYHTPCLVEENNGEIIFNNEHHAICKARFSCAVDISKSIRSLYYLAVTDTTCLTLRGRRICGEFEVGG